MPNQISIFDDDNVSSASLRSPHGDADCSVSTSISDAALRDISPMCPAASSGEDVLRSTALADLNKRNAEFWWRQSARTEKLFADEASREFALKRLATDLKHRVPVGSQISLDAALNEADDHRRAVLKQNAQPGANAPKQDALHKLIMERVHSKPKTTEKELLAYLEAHPKIFDVANGKIMFDRGNKVPLGEALVSGLKDRLSRAKKIINSQKGDSANSPK